MVALVWMLMVVLIGFVIIIIGNHSAHHSGSAFNRVFTNGINGFDGRGDNFGDARL